ncbi:hypothetical protein BH11BAC3_BH11BAC3_26090 [soil metagenome]
MGKAIFLFFSLFIGGESFCQSFLNGDFEINTAVTDRINIANITYNTLMANSTGFGSTGNIDVIGSDTLCGPAQSGNWFIALTGGGTDIVSLKLSTPLLQDKSYIISFYDRTCLPFSQFSYPLEVGASDVHDQFGSLIYLTPVATTTWTLRTFLFKAPGNAQFITVKVRAGNTYGTWCQLDNFSIKCVVDINLGNDTTLCEGKQLQLNATVPGASYQWQNNSTNSVFNVTAPGKYWVTVTGDRCSISDTINVSFRDCKCTPYIPNAFSPNGDGINDVWVIDKLDCFEKTVVQVYNRYGKLVYKSDNYRDNWNGTYQSKKLLADAYTYLIRTYYYDGHYEVLKGNLMILQ